MKKFLLLVVCCLVLFGLTSCDAASGTWKFKQVETEVMGFVKTIKVGDTDSDGNKITKEYFVLKFEEDGVIKGKSSLTSFEARKDGSKLIVKYLGSTYTLKR